MVLMVFYSTFWLTLPTRQGGRNNIWISHSDQVVKNPNAQHGVAYLTLECPNRLRPGPARKATFINDTIRINVPGFAHIKQLRFPRTLLYTAHQSPPAAPLLGHPLPFPAQGTKTRQGHLILSTQTLWTLSSVAKKSHLKGRHPNIS